jgi:hypothetical protein
VNPIGERVVVAPVIGQETFGMQVSLREKGISPARVLDDDRPRQWRFEFQAGGVWIADNLVAVPESGEPIDFRFDQESNPTTSIRVGIEHSRHDRHFFWLGLMPLEVRDFGKVPSDSEFAGFVVDDDLPLRTLYLLYDARFRYAYELRPDSKVSVKLGGGISYLDTEARLQVDEEEAGPGGGGAPDEFFGNGIGDHVVDFVPLAHASVGVRISKRLGFLAELDAGANSDDRYFDGAAIFQLYFGRRWQMQLGYRRIERKLETSDMFNEMQQNRTVIGVSYRL